MNQKSYNNTPTLYIIPTPIGNMDDITIRAIKIMTLVEVLYVEDTRITSLLLKKHKITKKLISNNTFNEKENIESCLKYLSDGFSVGLVSDRGTPLISDPGSMLVKTIIDNKYNVVALPGATAFVPALVMSGISAQRFTFVGFLSSKENELKKQLEILKDNEETLIFYESPNRIIKTLDIMAEILLNRQISISREISKKFEEVYRGTLCSTTSLQIKPKGEFVIVVSGNIEEYDESISTNQNVDIYVKQGFSIMEAIKKTAKEQKKTKSEVYDEYHKIDRRKL